MHELIRVSAMPAATRKASENWVTNPGYRRGLEKELAEIFRVVNFTKLCEIASSHKCGLRCSVDEAVYARDGVNIVFELCFEDGTTWIARIRIPDLSQPQSGIDGPLESEVTTMRYLAEHTSIPVPKVYGHDSKFGNPVGMPYI